MESLLESVQATAAKVFKATHPVKWLATSSPVVEIDGRSVSVEVRDGFFPLVILHPQEHYFRCFNPWGWPHIILRLNKNAQRTREETRRRILGLALQAKSRAGRLQ